MLEIQRVHDVGGEHYVVVEKGICLTVEKDPSVQKATGKTAPVDVMGKLREMKNNM